MTEKRFGVSFADVHVHTDNAAGQRAGALGAKAFTKGRDIYFAPGYYRPNSQVGLGSAHELTHVVQQRNGRFPIGSGSDHVAEARSRLEDEAEDAARTIQSSTQPLQIVEKALGNEVHRSPGLL